MFTVVSTCNIPFVVDERVFDKVKGIRYVNKPCHSEEAITAVAASASAVVVGHEPFTRKVIDGLTDCRLLVTPKTGYDNIDVAAATEKGICVSNVSGASTEEASDQTMALLLACARKLFKEDKAVRAGQWKSIHGPEMEAIWRGILPLRGRTLGLIGFGKIPRGLVPKAKGFSLKILVYDPFVSDDLLHENGVERRELNQLLVESDFVSIHCALTRDNYHLVGREQIKFMKRSAYLINTARGPLVDEKALYDALVGGAIAGAALDVLEVEPVRMDNHLLQLDNVIITGHSGHYSDLAIATIRRRPAEDVERVMNGQWPISWINPEVKTKYISRWGDKNR
jgi:D-3-phosphoglycerate dehydrogenase